MMKRIRSFESDRPIIYLIATPIGNLKDFSPRAIETLKNSDLVLCEDTRVTSKLFSEFDIHSKLMSSYSQIEDEVAQKIILDIVKNKKIVSFVSDAGYPGISDPGEVLVKKAREFDVPVSIIGGPSAFLLTLLGSSLNTSSFLFEGFLKVQPSKRIEQLERLKSLPDTLVIYEAPHRIKEVMHDLYEVLGNRKFCLARELTKVYEEYIIGNLSEMESFDYSSIKGEMVIAIEGNMADDLIDLNNVKENLMYLIEHGMSSKDAILYVSKQYDINKNTIYKLIK